MFAYLLLHVKFQEGKTLNAVLFETLTAQWGSGARWFVLVTLISEALLLFVAAQALPRRSARALQHGAGRWMRRNSPRSATPRHPERHSPDGIARS